VDDTAKSGRPRLIKAGSSPANRAAAAALFKKSLITGDLGNFKHGPVRIRGFRREGSLRNGSPGGHFGGNVTLPCLAGQDWGKGELLQGRAIGNLFEKYFEAVRKAEPIRYVGHVFRVQGLLIESRGPRSVIGELCVLEMRGRELAAEAVGLDGTTAGVETGMRVIATGAPLSVVCSWRSITMRLTLIPHSRAARMMLVLAPPPRRICQPPLTSSPSLPVPSRLRVICTSL